MPTHTLTGSGIQAISTPGSLAIEVTDGYASAQRGEANPDNLYHVGQLRIGNTHGYLPAVPIDAINMLMPCPVGATLLGYKLKSGVEIDVEERSEIIQPIGTLATSQSPPAPTIISPFIAESLGGFLAATATATPASGAYASANRAFYYPFRLSAPFTSTHAFWANGTATSGNIDVGVYSSSFARLASTGSTAQGTAAQVVSTSLAVTLQPGLYYLAVAMDNVTGRLYNSVMALPKDSTAGARAQATAFPLPNPMVPLSATGAGNIYLIGLSTYAP